MAYQELTKCRGCGETIRYIKIKKSGRPMPVNPKPVEVVPVTGKDKGGHSFVTMDGEVFRGRIKQDNGYYDVVDPIAASESHFATCSAADQFRKKK